jgi:hypothetical protein
MERESFYSLVLATRPFLTVTLVLSGSWVAFAPEKLSATQAPEQRKGKRLYPQLSEILQITFANAN